MTLKGRLSKGGLQQKPTVFSTAKLFWVAASMEREARQGNCAEAIQRQRLTTTRPQIHLHWTNKPKNDQPSKQTQVPLHHTPQHNFPHSMLHGSTATGSTKIKVHVRQLTATNLLMPLRTGNPALGWQEPYPTPGNQATACAKGTGSRKLYSKV